MPISFASLSGGGGGKIEVTKYFTGTTSWTCPDDVNEVYIFAGGGGGGGVRQSSNAYNEHQGGHGSATEAIVSVTPGQTYTVSIGAGGAGNNSGGLGSTGSPTSLGNIFSIVGGGGGFGTNSNNQYQITQPGGLGGVGAFGNRSNNLYAGKHPSGFHGRGGGGGVAFGASNMLPGADGGGSPRFTNGANVPYDSGRLNTGGGGATTTGFNHSAPSGGSGFMFLKYWTAE